MSDTLVIIPAYNEEQRIGDVVGRLAGQDLGWDILVVNDGSADLTAQRAGRAGARVVSHPFNLGYGAALQTAYKYALRNGYRYVLQMDADGQHPPEEVRKLMEIVKADEADVVFGSRFLGGGGYRVPFLRRAGIRLFGAMARLLTGLDATDVTTGFAAANRRAISVFGSDLFPADFPDADVRMMLHKMGLRVREVSVAMRAGPPQKSMHGGLASIWYIVKMFISIMIVWITHFRPPADKEE